MCETPVLQVQNLKQHFFPRRDLTIRAVDGVSFSIGRGETFGLVGESGCGKSTLARCIMGLYPLTGGQVLFNGSPVEQKGESAARRDRQKNMQMIFQDSAAALNPRMTVFDIVAEPLRACHMAGGREMDRQIAALLEQVGLESSLVGRRPGELSGGQRQRVAIARSIATRPQLIVADEPVASLDLSIQAQIMNLFQHLQHTHGFSFLFIAHDLSVVRYLCDRVGVMLRGRLVELAETEALFSAPLHPYTKALLSAMPVADPVFERQKTILTYDPDTLPENGQLLEAGPGHWVYTPAKD